MSIHFQDIIKSLNGKVVSKPEYLSESDGRINLIVTEGRATQDFDIYESKEKKLYSLVLF